MSGARHRQKGDRAEREIVDLHKDIDVHAERYPLSGASRFRGSGHDIDLYPFGREAAPLVAEVKARKNGDGLCAAGKMARRISTCCFCAETMPILWCVLPWRVWAALLTKSPRGAHA